VSATGVEDLSGDLPGTLLNFLYRQVDPERGRRFRKIAGDISDAIAGYVVGNFVISILAGL
jgi:predicted PurR-regulated permease PerM